MVQLIKSVIRSFSKVVTNVFPRIAFSVIFYMLLLERLAKIYQEPSYRLLGSLYVGKLK